MNILFDLVHPADVNVFSVTINRLLAEGHTVTCTVLRRGRLPKIVKKEFPGVEVLLLGRHRVSFVGKVLGIVLRECGFFRLYLRRRFDVVVGFGFYPGMLAWLRRSKSIHMHDDREYRMNFSLAKRCARRFIALCPATGKNVLQVKSFKELAYLSPQYRKTDDKVLARLGLKKGGYVYVREIANVSANYAGSTRIDYTPLFEYCKERGLTVLLDPEGEPAYTDVQVLKGVFSLPEHNSIKQHAALIVTSGDTVLREGALLGVPTIYTSDRVMAINEPLRVAGLFAVAHDPQEVLSLGKDFLQSGILAAHTKLANDFIADQVDINEVLYKEVLS